MVVVMGGWAATMQGPVKTLTFTSSKMESICRLWSKECHGLTYILKRFLCLYFENNEGGVGSRQAESGRFIRVIAIIQMSEIEAWTASHGGSDDRQVFGSVVD